MIHSMIFLMVLALSLGLGSISISLRYYSIYHKEFIKHLIIFLIALNTAAVIGIFYNYFDENLRSNFSEDVFIVVEISYRFVANMILFAVGGSMVYMLRALIDEEPSKPYITFLTIIWITLVSLFLIGTWFPIKVGSINILIATNLAIDLLVQYIVLFECIRSALRIRKIKSGIRRVMTQRFLTIFTSIWLIVILLSFLMLIDENGKRLYNLISSIVYMVFNALPIVFLKLFLLKSYKSIDINGKSNLTHKGIDDICSRFSITPREKEIITLVRKGHPNKKIAEELHISLSTVKDHNHHIFKKLNISNRTQLANFFNME